jgi:hypothetical protein
MKDMKRTGQIEGLWDFNKEPVQLDTKKVDDIINQPLDKNLEKLCELLAKD